MTEFQKCGLTFHVDSLYAPNRNRRGMISFLTVLLWLTPLFPRSDGTLQLGLDGTSTHAKFGSRWSKHVGAMTLRKAQFVRRETFPILSAVKNGTHERTPEGVRFCV